MTVQNRRLLQETANGHNISSIMPGLHVIAGVADNLPWVDKKCNECFRETPVNVKDVVDDFP